MNIIRSISKILVLFLAVGLVISCAPKQEAKVAVGDDIKIGISGPHTGAYAPFGEQLWRGATQAIEDINAAGGINGAMLVAVKGDDACDPEQAVKVAKRLLEQDKVTVVVGHFCSATSISASEIYAPADILMISPASTNPKVTERGIPTVMRVSGRDDQQGIVAGDYIADTIKAQSVVVIHDRDIYGQGLADATRSHLDLRGIEVVLYEGITRGEKDFGALVTKIHSLNPEVVYFGGLHYEAGILLRQLREQGVEAWFISGAGISSDDFVTVAGGPEFLTKTLMTFGADPRNADNNPAGAKVVAKFRSDGYEPVGYTLYAYTAVQVVAAALTANQGEKSGLVLSSWIKDEGVPTVMGYKDFDAKGDLKISDYVMYLWGTDGTYKEL